MAMQYEATLRLKGDDQTAEAFRSASESARRFADQQTRATRGLREDVDSVGRAFRGLRRTALVGGLAGVLTQAVTQAANFGDKLNRIGINARASEETMRRVGATLRQEASRLNLDIDKVVEGYDAWRVATGQSVEAALRSFPAIGEAAKAMNADVSTVGASMGSLASNLRLSGDDMRVTLDQMARAAGDIGVPFEEFSRNFGGMAEQMQRLGIQGAAGTEQMLGLFTAIQGRTNDANQTFRVMGELMNDLTSNDLLAGRMGQGRVQQIIQEVVANGGNVVDALGRIVEKLYGARMESPRVRAEMEAAFGRDVVNLLFATRDGLVDVEGATNRVRDSAGEMGLRLAQELASPAEPINKLRREFGEVLTSLGQVGLQLNEAFGSNNRSLLSQTADELRRINEAIGPIVSGVTALAQGNLGEAWEKLSGSEAVKGFFQMPTWQRPAWLGGGKQAGGPVEAGRPVVVGEAGAELFVPSQAGRIVPHALYGAALAAEYGLGVRGASTAMSGALRGHGGGSIGQVMVGGIPGAGVLQAMKTDSESGHPLRTRLRGMLGLENPGEPAPWQAGGQWHQSDSDAPDVVATRANTDAVGESTEQQFSLVEQLTDLNNSLRRLLGLGGAGVGGGAQIMQASFGGGGQPMLFGGSGGWGAGRAFGGGGTSGGGGASGSWGGGGPSPGAVISGGGDSGGGTAGQAGTGSGKAAAEAYLGRAISAGEYDSLMRATHAESGARNSPEEQAMIMGTILNRARTHPGGITGALTAKNQFQAVTGTRFEPGPSRNYRQGPSEARRGSIESAAQDLLHRVPTSQTNFTAASRAAYGPGTNVGYLAQLQGTGGAVYGGTQFGGRLAPAGQGGAAPEGAAKASGDAIPSNILAQAKQIALESGPGGVDNFLRSQGFPRNGAWCGQFAASVVKSQGHSPPKGQAVASNWRNFGEPVQGQPQPGDIAVRRGVRTGATGSHVTFVENVDPTTGRFSAVGGNQGASRAARAQGVTGRSNYALSQFEFRRAPQREAAAEPSERDEAERPIPIRFEHQPGETQMRRTSISREVDRSVREATLNSYADAGFA
jgi:Phage-related minor tail protein